VETAPTPASAQPEHAESVNSPVFRLFRFALVLVGGLLIAAVFALACTYVYLAPSLPTAENMHKVELQVPLRVYTSSGGLISQIGEQRRIPITYD
jgi:penicillin-binding protein 1A